MQCQWLVSLLLVLGTVLYTRTFGSFCLLCFFYRYCCLQTPAFLFFSVSFVFTGAISCKHLCFCFSLLCFYWYCFLHHTCIFVCFYLLCFFTGTSVFGTHLHFCLFLSPLFFTGTVSCTTPKFYLFLSPLFFYRYCSLCHTCIFFVCFCLLWGGGGGVQVLGYCLVHLHFCMFHFQYLCTPAHLFLFTGTGYCWVFVALCISSNGEMHMNLRRYLLCLCYFS